MSDRAQGETALVQFSERLTNSAAFGTLFREGMDLVEETAAYLDGAGRAEAKALERSVSLTYATESMRLTTRLMQLASWLLLHRAVKEGEMTLTQANREKTKVKLSAADPGAADMIEKLPQQLQDLIARSMALTPFWRTCCARLTSGRPTPVGRSTSASASCSTGCWTGSKAS